MEPSKQFSLNTTDITKIAKGAAVAFGGAAIMQISLYLSTGVPFDWKIWLTGILAVGINATWKFIQSPPQ